MARLTDQTVSHRTGGQTVGWQVTTMYPSLPSLSFLANKVDLKILSWGARVGSVG